MESSPVKVSDAVASVTRLALDTSPFIYFVENNANYIDIVRAIFKYIDDGLLPATTSSLTLTEVLVKPLKDNDATLITAYRDLLLKSRYLAIVAIDTTIADRAAHLRAKYNLKTPDALQVAAALVDGCDGFLTNDSGLKRISEISVLVVDELELDEPEVT
jgi:predicted nucleic acid-binding protein